jgi:hypothetical protein
MPSEEQSVRHLKKLPKQNHESIESDCKSPLQIEFSRNRDSIKKGLHQNILICSFLYLLQIFVNNCLVKLGSVSKAEEGLSCQSMQRLRCFCTLTWICGISTQLKTLLKTFWQKYHNKNNNCLFKNLEVQ